MNSGRSVTPAHLPARLRPSMSGKRHKGEGKKAPALPGLIPAVLDNVQARPRRTPGRRKGGCWRPSLAPVSNAAAEECVCVFFYFGNLRMLLLILLYIIQYILYIICYITQFVLFSRKFNMQSTKYNIGYITIKQINKIQP